MRLGDEWVTLVIVKSTNVEMSEKMLTPPTSPTYPYPYP